MKIRYEHINDFLFHMIFMKIIYLIQFIQKYIMFLCTMIYDIESGFNSMRNYCNNSAKFMAMWLKCYTYIWKKNEHKFIGGPFVAAEYPFDQIDEDLYPKNK